VKRRKTIAPAAALVAAVALLAGTRTAGSAGAAEVAIKDLTFTPAELTVHVGDTVEWINHDAFVHTATGTAKEFRVVIEPGKSARIVLKQAATVDYFCEYHPTMKGRIVVLGKERSASEAGSVRPVGLLRDPGVDCGQVNDNDCSRREASTSTSRLSTK
jgi:plastocyanin